MESELQQEISEAREKLKRKSGTSITKEEARIIVAFVMDEYSRDLTYNRAVRETMKRLGYPRRVVTKAYQSFKTHGEIRVPKRASRDAGRLTADVRAHIVRIINELNEKGTSTVGLIQARLRTPPDGDLAEGDDDYIRKPLTVSSSTVKRWLKLMGYNYVKGTKKFVVTDELEDGEGGDAEEDGEGDEIEEDSEGRSGDARESENGDDENGDEIEGISEGISGEENADAGDEESEKEGGGDEGGGVETGRGKRKIHGDSARGSGKRRRKLNTLFDGFVT